MDWDTRFLYADGLFDKQSYADAAEIVWSGRFLPSNDLDIALAIRILAQAQPRKAIRLISAVLLLNQGKPAHNMAMAAALLHYGLVAQAIRFYAAALEYDATLVNADMEHLILKADDKGAMLRLLQKKIPDIGQVQRKLRDFTDALDLSTRVNLHADPIPLHDLAIAAGEQFKNEVNEAAFAEFPASSEPISKSAVPTSVLRVKWSSGPAKPGDGDISVTPAPVAPPTAPAAPAEPPAPGPRKLHIPGQ